MPLSPALMKRREYPEVNPRTKEKLTDLFMFKYINPENKRIETKPLKYLQRLARPMPVDVFNLESEIGTKPNCVLKMLYYKRDEKKQEWVETEAKLQDPYLSEDITDLYYKEIRPGAYPKGYEDIYGPEAPEKLSQQEIYVQQLETLVSLAKNNLDAARRGMKEREVHTSNREVVAPGQGAQPIEFNATT
jgi:hypothetical protein